MMSRDSRWRNEFGSRVWESGVMSDVRLSTGASEPFDESVDGIDCDQNELKDDNARGEERELLCQIHF